VEFSYKAWLGITDAGSYLLLPKPIREGAGAETKYQTETEVLGLFPLNDDRTIDLIDSKASLVSQYIPTTGTVLTFDAPRSYGSLKSPRTALTLSFTGAKPVQKSIFFLEATSIPAAIASTQSYMVPIQGDAFDVTAGTVNVLEITQTTEESPQNNLITIRNTAIDMTSVGVDPLLGLYYNFEETAGFENDFIDQTGYANNGVMIEGSDGLGTPSTASRGTGIDGQSLLSVDNGATSTSVELVEILHDPSIAVDGDFSLSFWIKATNFANISGIFSKDVTSVVSSGFAIWLDTDGRIQTRINNSTSSAGTGGRMYSIGTIPTGVWKHVVYTHKRGVESKIYIDGVLDNTLVTTILLNVLSDNAYIGVNNPISFITRGLRLGDELDEMKFWKKELSAAEALAEFNIYGS
jgi:hypothetical protein